MYTVAMNKTIIKSGKNNIFFAFMISVLVHAVLVVVFSISRNWDFLNNNQSTLPERMKQMNFEIIETPNNSEDQKPLHKTLFLSDKNSRVSDLSSKDRENGNLPFSTGNIKEKSLASAYMHAQRSSESINDNSRNYRGKRNVQENESGNTFNNQITYYNEFSKALLKNPSYTPSSSGSYSQPQYNQTEIDAQNQGGITFNTYNWDFAPYLLYLKKRIQGNIYPPASFTRLGFSGENIISFRIYPNGRMADPGVRGFTGSEALVHTSVKAVEMSAPFKPLPDNFPEEYLLVTAKFTYYLLSNN